MAIAGREESAHLKGADRSDEDVGRPDLIERPKCKDAIPLDRTAAREWARPDPQKARNADAPAPAEGACSNPVHGLPSLDAPQALPPKARLSCSYQGEEGGEGFIGLRKL